MTYLGEEWTTDSQVDRHNYRTMDRIIITNSCVLKIVVYDYRNVRFARLVSFQLTFGPVLWSYSLGLRRKSLRTSYAGNRVASVSQVSTRLKIQFRRRTSLENLLVH